MEQKMYAATLRFRGSALHTMQLEITRHELKLLAFLHGAEAFPPKEIKYLGKRVITELMYVDGVRHENVIRTEMEEMKRLARKYDTLGDHDGILRGKKNVEACFKTTLDDFEDIFAAVDPVVAAEAALLAAEVKAEEEERKLKGGGLQLEEAPVVEDEPAPQILATKPDTLAGMGDVFKRTMSERVQP